MAGKFANMGAASLRKRHTVEDEDPTSGLANLADCMLVLACGLMVALVIAWDVDITTVEVTKSEQTREISDIETIDESTDAGANTFVDMGRVYQDPETGKLYVVENAD